ncbi:hypothetical protein PUMCH_001785 [Australozyma saopauloensis]|uniref:Uncharacterized protein n=1 Tax=Australozyma saopauloensis TaxID=291208 RepID=A0AAX4H7X5_9ASCO|nr:hypothetical protein PUMCH_001785 [[Candida] saopauloensis]
MAITRSKRKELESLSSKNNRRVSRLNPESLTLTNKRPKISTALITIAENNQKRRFDSDLRGRILRASYRLRANLLNKVYANSGSRSRKRIKAILDNWIDSMELTLDEYQARQKEYLGQFRSARKENVFLSFSSPHSWKKNLRVLMIKIGKSMVYMVSRLEEHGEYAPDIRTKEINDVVYQIKSEIENQALFFSLEFQYAFSWLWRLYLAQKVRALINLAKRWCVCFWFGVLKIILTSVENIEVGERSVAYTSTSSNLSESHFKISISTAHSEGSLRSVQEEITDTWESADSWDYSEDPFAKCIVKSLTATVEEIEFWPDEQFGPMPDFLVLRGIKNALEPN